MYKQMVEMANDPATTIRTEQLIQRVPHLPFDSISRQVQVYDNHAAYGLLTTDKGRYKDYSELLACQPNDHGEGFLSSIADQYGDKATNTTGGYVMLDDKVST